MPLTLTLTEDVLPTGNEKQAVARTTDSKLKWHGLTGNKIMTPNITATVHVLPKGSTFSGGKEFPGDWNLDGQALTNEELDQAISQG